MEYLFVNYFVGVWKQKFETHLHMFIYSDANLTAIYKLYLGAYV